jgi:hypothetical protein
MEKENSSDDNSGGEQIAQNPSQRNSKSISPAIKDKKNDPESIGVR